MTTSLHCGPAVHAAIAADLRTFARGALLGYQQVTDDYDRVTDLLELRRCPHCGHQISRRLGIAERLQRARSSRDGLGDQAMIGICKRALNPDPFTDRIDHAAIRTFLDAVTFERLMPEVRHG